VNHQLEIHEGAAPSHPLAPQIALDLREYTVVAAGGVFKRGRLWLRGERIELERTSALNFLAAGDIREI
jgi:hypothetical protein